MNRIRRNRIHMVRVITGAEKKRGSCSNSLYGTIIQPSGQAAQAAFMFSTPYCFGSHL